jgi:hypothetical protein
MTEPYRTREQIAAEIETERQGLLTAIGALRKSRDEAASKAKKTIPIVAVIVAVGGFLVTSAFLATVRFLWRRVARALR